MAETIAIVQFQKKPWFLTLRARLGFVPTKIYLAATAWESQPPLLHEAQLQTEQFFRLEHDSENTYPAGVIIVPQTEKDILTVARWDLESQITVERYQLHRRKFTRIRPSDTYCPVVCEVIGDEYKAYSYYFNKLRDLPENFEAYKNHQLDRGAF